MGKRLTIDDFNLEASKTDCVWLGDESYIPGSPERTLWRCNNCGEDYLQSHNSKRNNGSRCRKCFGRNVKFTKDDFHKLAKETGVVWIEENPVPRNNARTNWVCIENNHKINQSYVVRKAVKNKCHFCANVNVPVTINDYNSLEGFTFLGYSLPQNSSTSVEWKCNDCATIFTTSYSNIKYSNTRCPACAKKSNKGETRIRDFLIKKDMVFESEKSYPDLLGTKGGRLYFDFYVPSLNTIIEYNGVQHYESVKFFGGNKRFNQRSIHDERKINYTLDKGINLIIIPHTAKDNIETHLEGLLIQCL